MTRVNVLLLLLVLASAMYLVNVQYESRRLFTAMDKALAESRKLEAERERLNLEKRAQATPLRVDKIAREQLQMRVATPAITQYVQAPGVHGAAGATHSTNAVTTASAAKPVATPAPAQAAARQETAR